MKKLIFLLGFYLISFSGIAQSKDGQSGSSHLLSVNSSAQAIELAKQDILSGTPFLLLQSGFVSTVHITDKAFENKYQIAYHDLGCLGPQKNFLQEYNKVIFKYLTEKYGKDWLKEAREDVVGFKDLTGC